MLALSKSMSRDGAANSVKPYPLHITMYHPFPVHVYQSLGNVPKLPGVISLVMGKVSHENKPLQVQIDLHPYSP